MGLNRDRCARQGASGFLPATGKTVSRNDDSRALTSAPERARVLRRAVTAVVARPKAVIAAIIVVTLGLGACASRLKVLLDLDDQLPAGHPLVVVGKRIEKTFGGKYLTVIGFYPVERDHLHARDPGEGATGDHRARDPSRGQGGQRVVADVGANQRRAQRRRVAGDHAARCPGAALCRPSWRRFGRGCAPMPSSPPCWSATMGVPPRCSSTSTTSRRRAARRDCSRAWKRSSDPNGRPPWRFARPAPPRSCTG